MMKNKESKGFGFGLAVGVLGGLIGLGGAEFRLPILAGIFRIPTLEAIILNKALSMIVVASALIFRSSTIPFGDLWQHWDIIVNLLIGSLVGAWLAADYAMTLSRVWLNRVIMVILGFLAIFMLVESILGLPEAHNALGQYPLIRWGVGIVAGLFIGVVAALLGVAGGELLIPAIVLIFGQDIKLAGSLSLAVSLPTMCVGFCRYSRSTAFAVIRNERSLFIWMGIGSVLGPLLGSFFLGIIPQQILVAALAVILLISTIKIFKGKE